ncbi:MAG: dephospho-CoA kinase [Alphaproteobacteria bacterium]|nr:dephospho-CoA kinase [Alphaproteobacteria bacterium]
MKILGLTGGIGMGKSTASALLTRLGVPIYDADRAVHALLAPGGAAVKAVARAFPAAKSGTGISRPKLGKLVFGKPTALRRLEAILHPLVRQQEKRFLRRMRARRARLVVLDIPLLYETGGENRCDAVAVVWAPAALQRDRVLRRPGMDAKRLRAILAQQMPDRAKRVRADFAVPSGLGRAVTRRALQRALAALDPPCRDESEAAD